jgi:hypothetical protein
MVGGKSRRLHFPHAHLTPRYLLDNRRCSALNISQEDHAYLPDKSDALSHTTSRKLAARAAELTVHEL